MARSKNHVYKVTNSTRRSELFIARDDAHARALASTPFEAGGYSLLRFPYSDSAKCVQVAALEQDPDLKPIIKTGQTGMICRGWVEGPGMCMQDGPWQLANSYYAVSDSGQFYGPFPNSYSVYLASCGSDVGTEGGFPGSYVTVQTTTFLPKEWFTYIDWKQVL